MWIKNMILIIYLLELMDLMYRIKKMNKKVNHGWKKLLLKVKLRGQEADEEGLSDMSQLESNGKKVKKGKVLKLLPQTNC